MAHDEDCRFLRIATYMVPDYPLGLYQTLQHYIESVVGCQSLLSVELRVKGGFEKERNPFVNNWIDLAFMFNSTYIASKEQDGHHMELLHAVPVREKPKGVSKPEYFGNLILSKSRVKTGNYKNFEDLKGHRWAYSDENSFAAYVYLLHEMKQNGVNTTFFGDLLKSGSDRHSIDMVAGSIADAACVDSNVFQLYVTERPELLEKCEVVNNWGPFPMHPVVVNSRLPENLKKKLTQALLDVDKDAKWSAELKKYGVWGFRPVDASNYSEGEWQKELREAASCGPRDVYY